MINTTKKCRRCKENLQLSLFAPMNMGKYGRASTCIECIKKNVGKETRVSKQLRGKVQQTIPQEKLKAYVRDKKCIIPYCNISEYQRLDFHHVYYKALERKYTEERNLVKNGVMLCRQHHQELTDGDTKLDQYCRDYLFNIYLL